MDPSSGRAHPVALGAAPRAATVFRRRLLERLDARFEARVTTIVGGAGSGKTTLLAHALRIDGPRVDVWYPCSSRDRDSDRLLTELVGLTADALDEHHPDDIIDPTVALGELVLSASPEHICIVIDDAHLLGDTDVVDRLVDGLPTNGHVLIAGRSLPTFSDARLDVRGELVRIRQEELMLTDDELVEFANLRGIDADSLRESNGWPAFAELAARGHTGSSRSYLEQEALDEISIERRESLAAFSFVGGGDDDIAIALSGMNCAELTAGLPLVRWSGTVAILHDLWRDILADSLSAEQRRHAAETVSALYEERRELDAAIDLLTTIGSWSKAEDVMASAVRDGVGSGMQRTTLQRWIDALPVERHTQPLALLLRGIVAREIDPTAPEAAELFDASAAGFQDQRDDGMELVALLQLGYLARVSMDASRITPVAERLTELAERHPPARPFLAFSDGFLAIADFRHDLLLAAMESILDAELPVVWQLSRDSWISDAQRTLGYPDRALAAAPAADAFTTPVPGALVSRSMSLWMCGRPTEARHERSLGLEHRFGARDRGTAGIWMALMDAWAGHVDDASEELRIARTYAGQSPPIGYAVQSLGVELVLQLAEGDEAGAAQRLEELLAFAPLEDGLSAMQLRNFIALPYLLVPSSRPYWDTADLGPSVRAEREAARALLDARNGDPASIGRMRWPDPAALAVTFPVRLAMEFALRGAAAGRDEGHRLARWLCEHWGPPALNALRMWSADEQLGAICADVLAHTPLPPDEEISIRVLGRAGLLVDGYATTSPDWRRSRVRALLIWLIVNRRGTRDQIAGRLWPDLDGAKAARNLRTTLNYLHGLLEPTRPTGQAPWSVRIDGPEILLESSLDVDAWSFTNTLDQAERAQRDGRVTTALPLLLGAVEMYHGDLAPDLDHEWLDLERIHLRSRFVRAACRAAELLVALDRPDEAVNAARRSLEADAWHEPSYQVLASAYDLLGDSTSARDIRRRAAERLDDL